MNTQLKKRKVHSLTGRINFEMMVNAFKAVKRNRGAAGIDKISIDLYSRYIGTNLENLMRQLKDRSYVPKPLKRVYIPKGKGKMRPLGIPSVQCRIAQEVVRQLINPIFEKKFHNSSYGFRPGRNCHQAIYKVKEYLDQGYRYIVDADIKGFFDNIPHKLIMSEVAAEIADGNILQLIERFLKSGVMEEGKLRPTSRGTPQGGVISPILANVVLNRLDHEFESKGYKFVRYADDFVILCKSMHEAEEALAFAKGILEDQMELEFSPEKTKIVHLKDGFDFLGFHFAHKGITMREKSLEKFKDAVRMHTIRSRNMDRETIEKLNQVIRGTVNYFSIPIATIIKQITLLDRWIRVRVRSMKYKCISKCNNWKMKSKYIYRLGLLSCIQLCKQRMNGVYVPYRATVGASPGARKMHAGKYRELTLLR
jgi:RNA-directed DNA polymerase